MKAPIHVLVVDDSALVRQVTAGVLGRRMGFTVSVAVDPLIARKMIAIRRPDAILLDLEMPRMDGLTFLKQLMADDPIPVVIFSSFTQRGSKTALRALELGALDVIGKPKYAVKGFVEDSAILLIDALRGAAGAKMRRRKHLPASAKPIAPSRSRPLIGQGPMHRQLIAIGASTGGTDAIRYILESMPLGCPALLIAQHMPEGFTAAFASHTNATCTIEVREAAPGDILRPGLALIAAGDRHLEVCRSNHQYMARLSGGPLVSRHRPSVDVLFRSAAKTLGGDALGILLTGMGEDGAEGLLSMRQAGAETLAQDDASCVVFGMPSAAIALDATSKVLPLAGIPMEICRWANSKSRQYQRA